MTALDLQDALMEDVKVTLKDIITEDASGERVEGVKVFAQQLPVITTDEEDDTQFMPYAVIKILDGGTASEGEPWTVTMGIYLGIYDADQANQGHRHVMVMTQRIIDRFVSEHLLDDRYWAQPEIEWVIDSEDGHPFFYGGVCIKFSVPKIGRRMTEYD